MSLCAAGSDVGGDMRQPGSAASRRRVNEGLGQDKPGFSLASTRSLSATQQAL